MKILEIRQTQNPQEIRYIHDIRTEVFVNEQHVTPDEEFDGFDDSALHFIAYYDKTPIGCARIRMTNCVKLERIAILKSYRGRGFGKQLTQHLINFAKSFDYPEICIHSQLAVKEFYRKCGFQERGDIFLEADIKHIAMYMKNKH